MFHIDYIEIIVLKLIMEYFILFYKLYIKDLRIIDRDLKNILILDNSAYSFCF